MDCEGSLVPLLEDQSTSDLGIRLLGSYGRAMNQSMAARNYSLSHKLAEHIVALTSTLESNTPHPAFVQTSVCHDLLEQAHQFMTRENVLADAMKDDVYRWIEATEIVRHAHNLPEHHFGLVSKAVGVGYVPSRNRGHKGQHLETIVKACKFVLISSGTLGTPQILERSGVGDGKSLKKLDIKAVSDLPGVGEECQDHYTTLSIYRVSNESFTTDDLLRGVPEVQKAIFAEWEASPERAKLSSNGIDAGFKIRPTEEELMEMGPEFNELWNGYLIDKPDKPVMFGSTVSGGWLMSRH